jgi:hypothetical protein
MKHQENLTRIHISEAIQTGLKSQTAQRALAGEPEPVSPRLEITIQEPSKLSDWFSRLRLMYFHILNPGGS